MEVVSGFASLTEVFNKVLEFSGLVGNRNDLKTKAMEEKALEVYGERPSTGRTGTQCQPSSTNGANREEPTALNRCCVYVDKYTGTDSSG